MVHARAQMQLDGSFSDISNIRLWAADSASATLAVWLSSDTTYSAGTACAQNVAMAGIADRNVTCPAASSVRYATVVRTSSASAVLIIHEMYVYRVGE